MVYHTQMYSITTLDYANTCITICIAERQGRVKITAIIDVITLAKIFGDRLRNADSVWKGEGGQKWRVPIN